MGSRRGFLQGLGLGAAALFGKVVKSKADTVKEAFPDNEKENLEALEFTTTPDAKVKESPTNVCLKKGAQDIYCSGFIPNKEDKLSEILNGGSGKLDLIWGPEFKHGLKADRICNYTDCRFFMNETAERGMVVSADPNNENCVRKQQGNEKPLGILLNDVVSFDFTRQLYIPWFDEIAMGGKVEVVTDGEVTIKCECPAGGIKPNDYIYSYKGTPYGEGKYSSFCMDPRIGTSLSYSDEDGYVKIQLDINSEVKCSG